jgi:hypothetical protein
VTSGLWLLLEYNEAATKDAQEKVRAFLAANLAGMPSDKPGTE